MQRLQDKRGRDKKVIALQRDHDIYNFLYFHSKHSAHERRYLFLRIRQGILFHLPADTPFPLRL